MNIDPKLIKLANRRIFLILAGQFSLFSVIIYRLFHLQVVRHKEYLAFAENNQLRTVVEPVARGLILDKNNIVLADNSIEYLIVLDSKEMKKIEELDDFLKKIHILFFLGEEDEIRIKNLFEKKRRFIEIKSIKFDDFVSVRYSMDSLSGILISKKYVRIYPFADVAAHIVGYVTNENKKYSNNYYVYSNDFKIGKTGIEQKYNDVLSGTNRITTLQVDAKGRKIGEIESMGGENGLNLRTTINIKLQEMIYSETFGQTMNAVVIDVKNQSLTAMVSSPSFNPEILNNDELRKSQWSSLALDVEKPLINKAISGLYSPGSAFKIVVALAALELGIINENSNVFCNGEYQIGNRTYHCLHYHGTINLHDAIEKSCNSFFYSLAKKMDIKFLEEIALSLGFGKVSNLDLRGESKGTIPSKLWKLKKIGSLWYVGDTANYMIGQGYLTCNCLQLCTSGASIASGNLVDLTVIEENLYKKVIQTNSIIKKDNFKIVRGGMFAAMNNIGGTGYKSLGSQYRDLKICGKTGTVQISSNRRDKNHSVFVGYAPFDNPRYAVAVIGELMGYGASFAAPLAGKIFDFLK